MLFMRRTIIQYIEIVHLITIYDMVGSIFAITEFLICICQITIAFFKCTKTISRTYCYVGIKGESIKVIIITVSVISITVYLEGYSIFLALTKRKTCLRRRLSECL